MNIVAIFRKKSLNSTTRINPDSNPRRGKAAWAEVFGQIERVLVYGNPDLRTAEGKVPPWLKRWTSLEELRLTPRVEETEEEKKDREYRMRKKDRCKRESLAGVRLDQRLLTHGYRPPVLFDKSSAQGSSSDEADRNVGWGLCDEGEFPFALT